MLEYPDGALTAHSSDGALGLTEESSERSSVPSFVETDDATSAETLKGNVANDPDKSHLPVADRSIKTLQAALRLALRATGSDIACIVARNRVVLWASHRRNSNGFGSGATDIFPFSAASTPLHRNSNVLSRWLSRTKTLSAPISRNMGMSLLVARRRRAPDYTDGDSTLLEDASRLAASEVELAFSRLINSSLTTSLDCSRIGLILTDKSARLIYANQAAKRFITAGGGIRVADGRLSAKCRDKQGSLREFLNNVSDSLAIGIETKSGAVSPVGVRCIQAKGRNLIALFVNDPESATPPTEWLQDVYRMTKREAEVGALLAQGLNVSEVAEELQLSETTIKSYCKDVFSKLEVRRKPDLVKILGSGPLALSAPISK